MAAAWNVSIRRRASADVRKDIKLTKYISFLNYAAVAELVDALPWGGSGSNPVEVQVLSSAPRRQDTKGD